jgi:hypothetical protein
MKNWFASLFCLGVCAVHLPYSFIRYQARNAFLYIRAEWYRYFYNLYLHETIFYPIG